MLRDLGLSFEIQAPDVEETRLRGESAPVFAQRLAIKKAESVAHARRAAVSADWAVLAADTVVIYGDLVLGKPGSADEAVRMLRKLSGRTHVVLTAYHWLGSRSGKLRSGGRRIRTRVTFAEMSPEFCRWYVSTGEPMDKAGAYAAQGIGMSFIKRVNGSYSNVVGLPLSEVLESFKKFFGGDLREYCTKS